MGEGWSFSPGGASGHASSTQRVESTRGEQGTTLRSHRGSPAGPVPGRCASPAWEVSLLTAWDARRKTAFLFLPEGKMGPLVTHPARHLFRAAGTPQGIRSATVLWWRTLGPKSSCSRGPGQGRGESPRLGWRRPASVAWKSSAKAAAARPLAAGAPRRAARWRQRRESCPEAVWGLRPAEAGVLGLGRPGNRRG